MNIANAVSKALTRRAAGTGHGASGKTLAELERLAGGKKEAARAAGVSDETWRRWRNGSQKPSRGKLEGLESALRRGRLRPGREGRLRRPGAAVTLSGRVRVSNDSRDRTIDLAAMGDLDLDALVDAYLAGDEELQQKLIQDAVDTYVPGMEIEDIHGLTISAGHDDE